MDELLHETDASKKKELMDTPLGKKLTPLLAKFDELRKALELKVDKAPRLVTLIRMVACFFYLLIWLPVFASCSMLRPLHPLLRKLGIPERYFSLDIVIRTYSNGNFPFPLRIISRYLVVVTICCTFVFVMCLYLCIRCICISIY